VSARSHILHLGAGPVWRRITLRSEADGQDEKANRHCRLCLVSSLGWANHQMGPQANKNSPNIIIKSGVE